MKRAVTAVVVAALLIGGLSVPEYPLANAFSAGGFALTAAAVATSAPAAAEGDFNWNGVWQYSAQEQQFIGPSNPFGGYTGPLYKAVQVTETLTINPYANPQIKEASYMVVWSITEDDGKTVNHQEKAYLAAAGPYRGYDQGAYKAEMEMVPFDGTNVDYSNYYSSRKIYATNAGEIEHMDQSKIFVRLSEGPSMKKELEVSGVLRGVDDKALPRMKMAVDVYYDKDSMTQKWEDSPPDLHEAFASDLQGAFSVTFPIRADVTTKIGVVITLTFRCQLPQGEVFSITDLQSPDSSDGISVSTLVTIDPTDQAFQNEKQISVNRSILLFRPFMGLLTLDDDKNQEPMQTNVKDPMKFLGYSYLYRNLWDALTVVGLFFDELPALLQSPTGKPLQVECNYPANRLDPDDRSHYSVKDNAIRLEETDCFFNDNSRFVALHEFGHFVDAATNGWKARCNYSTKIAAGDLQHGGYLNSSTADSFTEGFATWFACVCQLYRKDPNPYVAGSWDLSEPGYWRAWADGGKNEELSVAAVLLKAMYQFEDVKDFWQSVLWFDRDNFYLYYKKIRDLLGEKSGKMTLINGYMIDAGLFRMPSGNGQYDPGEPYRDLNRDGHYSAGGENYTDANNNGKFDPGEPFVDADGDKHFDAVEEPYQDGNGDGQYDFGEFYTDLDGDGRHDEGESYTDTDADGAWDPGEPFVDSNKNGMRDTTEPYGDLMYPYDASSQCIDTSTFPASFDPTKGVGESAAYNYPNRKSILLEDNCFVALSGETADALKVAVRLADGVSYAYVTAPTDKGIYVGLPNGAHGGTVEISVPGGKTIYRGEVRTLQARISGTVGQSAPLDKASITSADLAPAGTLTAPTGGDAQASGVFEPVEMSNQEAATLAGHYDPDADMSAMPDVSIAEVQPGTGEEGANQQGGEPEETQPEETQPEETQPEETQPAPGHTPQEETFAAPAIVDVAAGEYFTLGLRRNGTVVAAGDNAYGQCDVGGWTEVVAIAAGLRHSVGLRRDGTVLAAGDNELGQCDVDGWEDIVQVAAGYGHTLGLKSDGTVVAAGYNGDGQCNVSAWRDISSIAAGGWHTVGLKAGGVAVAAGYNQYGQCDVKRWSGIAGVAAGGWHTIGIKGNGGVVSTGYEDSGQCDVGGWRSIAAVSASGYHTVGLGDDGAVFAEGNDNFGQCGVGAWENVVRVAAGGYHTVGLVGDGSLVAVGNDEYGQCEIAEWGSDADEEYDDSGE